MEANDQPIWNIKYKKRNAWDAILMKTDLKKMSMLRIAIKYNYIHKWWGEGVCDAFVFGKINDLYSVSFIDFARWGQETAMPQIWSVPNTTETLQTFHHDI